MPLTNPWPSPTPSARTNCGQWATFTGERRQWYGWSFQFIDYSNKYIRHYSLNVHIASNGGSNAWDATASWTADTSWNKASPWS